MLSLSPSAFLAFKRWDNDTRLNNLVGSPPAHNWGSWCSSASRDHRLFIDGGTITGENHQGQPWQGWGEYYFRDVTFDNLRWATESNAGNSPGAMIGCDFRRVREDAIRGLYGHIEDITVHSVNRIPGAHGDTIQWEHDLVDAGLVKNVTSVSGDLHGIITRGVDGLVIDGFRHVHPGNSGWSIMFRGFVDNITIRNCVLSGSILFQGGRGPNVVIEDSVRQNVPKEQV